jgi:hypothetical protein
MPRGAADGNNRVQWAVVGFCHHILVCVRAVVGCRSVCLSMSTAIGLTLEAVQRYRAEVLSFLPLGCAQGVLARLVSYPPRVARQRTGHPSA